MYQLKTLFASAVLSLLLLAGCGNSAPGAAQDADDILRAEQQRVEYLTSGQLDRLEEMSSPTMTYTHSNGTKDDKEVYFASLRSGQVVYRDLDHDDLEVRFVGQGVAILNGISDVTVTVDGEDRLVPLRFTIVYVYDGNQWLFEAWHSSGRQN